MSNVQISWQVTEQTEPTLVPLLVSVAGTEPGPDVGSATVALGTIVPPAPNAVVVSWLETEAIGELGVTPTLFATVTAQEPSRDTAMVVLDIQSTPMLVIVSAQELERDTAMVVLDIPPPQLQLSVSAQESGRDTALVVVGPPMPHVLLSVSAQEIGPDTGSVSMQFPVVPLTWGVTVVATESGADVGSAEMGLRIRTTEPSLEVAYYPITSHGREILGVFERQPAEVKDFDISFADYLFAHRDTARSYDPVELQVPDTLRLLEQQWIGSRGYLKIWVAGMIDRRSYKITAWLNTEGGRRLEADVMVVVRES